MGTSLSLQYPQMHFLHLWFCEASLLADEDVFLCFHDCLDTKENCSPGAML